MTRLYITADLVGEASGGGQVTAQEAQALRELDQETEVWDRRNLQMVLTSFGVGSDPWCWDEAALWMLKTRGYALYKLHVHFYAGTFSKTISFLKEHGAKVTYTAAAHEVSDSQHEHEKLGIPFDYPHLYEPELFKEYVRGYKQADLLFCPSTQSQRAMRGFGCDQGIVVIPHGVTLPDPASIQPAPLQFTVGYLGAVGPDKGLIYLFQAWANLNYPDATLLVAGRYANSEFVHSLRRRFPGGRVELRGWVEKVADFYNAISLYVQPSVTEGFGIEVLEALSYSRPVLCSSGAGAADVVPGWYRFQPRDVDGLALRIDQFRRGEVVGFLDARDIAEAHAWPLIRERYKQVWKNL